PADPTPEAAPPIRNAIEPAVEGGKPFGWGLSAPSGPAGSSIFGDFGSGETTDSRGPADAASEAPSRIADFFTRGAAEDLPEAEPATARLGDDVAEPSPDAETPESTAEHTQDAQGADAQGIDAQRADAQGVDAQGAEPEATMSPPGGEEERAQATAPDAERPGLIRKLFGRGKKSGQRHDSEGSANRQVERDYSANTAWLEPTGTDGSDSRTATGGTAAGGSALHGFSDHGSPTEGTEAAIGVDSESPWTWSSPEASAATTSDALPNPWQPSEESDSDPGPEPEVSVGDRVGESDDAGAMDGLEPAEATVASVPAAEDEDGWQWAPEPIEPGVAEVPSEELHTPQPNSAPLDSAALRVNADPGGWDPEAWDSVPEAEASPAVEAPERAPSAPILRESAPESVPSARILHEAAPVSRDWWAEVEAIEQSGGSATHLLPAPQERPALPEPERPPLPPVVHSTAYWADIEAVERPPAPDAAPAVTSPTAAVTAEPAEPVEQAEAHAEVPYWADVRDAETGGVAPGPELPASTSSEHADARPEDDVAAAAQSSVAPLPELDAPMDDDPWAEVPDGDEPVDSPAQDSAPPDSVTEDDDPWAAFLGSRSASAEPAVGAKAEQPAGNAAWREAFASQPTSVPGAGAIEEIADSALGAGQDASLADELASNVDDDPWRAFDVQASEDERAEGRTGGEVSEDSDGALVAGVDPWSGIGASGAVAGAVPISAGEPDAESQDNTGAVNDEPGLDLAASLESQVAAAGDDDPYDGPRHELFMKPAGWAPAAFTRRASFDAAGAPAGTPSHPDANRDGDPHVEDVVLQAFERHAAGQDEEQEWDAGGDEPAPVAFDDLLGDDAEDLIAEPQPDDGAQSFARLQGWAPQRGTTRTADPLDAPWAPDDGTSGGVYAPGKSPDVATPDETPPAPPPPWAIGDESDDSDAGGAAAARAKRSRSKTFVRELVETGLLAILVFLAVRASFQNFKVDGTSMYPTLHNGQFLIVNKLVYSEINTKKLSSVLPFVSPGKDGTTPVFHGPERGDIVVLVDPRQPGTDLIKRVIGLPGETLQIVDGRVYINDHLLVEPYIKTPWHDNKAKLTIPEGDYFVMGDNRDNSLDSRSNQVGFIPSGNIIGKAMLSYWPSSEFGLAPNGSPTLSPNILAPKNAAAAPTGN
ncbi:MAG TPA: signal peptidase I, partial [Tepidiformaceae bacterium]|nr:signal peptidase I [Tepidiformaceae bacterium]